MDPVLLSRLQFATTTMYHMVFSHTSIGLAFMVFLMKTAYMVTKDEKWNEATRFWAKVLGLFFVLGVPTGILLEFEFGANFARYSEFVGSVFGPPLILEGLLAFALESTFIGIVLFGEKRVPQVVHWVATFLVAIGSMLSALWILIANSWQQTPSGYAVEGGRAVLVDFQAAVLNPSMISTYTHTVGAGLLMGAGLVAGVSAYHLMKGKSIEVSRKALKMGVVAVFLLAIFQLFPTGDISGKEVAQYQPAKLAAAEGVFESYGSCAPEIIFGIPDVDAMAVKGEVGIPCLLSLLSFGDTDAPVQGLEEFPRDEWPPVLPTYVAFRIMIGLGTLFIVLGLLGVVYLGTGSLYEKTWYLKGLVFNIPLPIIAGEAGWAVAEIGRQPWIVYGLLKTADGASNNVPASHILLTEAGVVAIYVVLAVVFLGFFKRLVDEGPEEVV